MSDESIIDERTASEIIRRYSSECSQIDRESLVAVYVIGSLSGGYYRPGDSDIDAILLVSDGSERIWGNSDTKSTRLVNLNNRYKQDYGIPKDFGPFPLQLRELYPPYKPDRELTLEVARLKLQGKAVYGTFSLKEVPMPSKEDFLLDFKHFEEWWDTEFSRYYPIEQLSLRGCVNTVLLHLNRYLIMRADVTQFDKRKIIPLCISYDAPFLDQTAIDVVDRHLKCENVAEEEIDSITRYASHLRRNMNEFLGISSE